MILYKNQRLFNNSNSNTILRNQSPYFSKLVFEILDDRNKIRLPLQNHVDGVVVLDEVVLLLDEEVVDARDVDVHLAKALVLFLKKNIVKKHFM